MALPTITRFSFRIFSSLILISRWHQDHLVTKVKYYRDAIQCKDDLVSKHFHQDTADLSYSDPREGGGGGWRCPGDGRVSSVTRQTRTQINWPSGPPPPSLCHHHWYKTQHPHWEYSRSSLLSSIKMIISDMKIVSDVVGLTESPNSVLEVTNCFDLAIMGSVGALRVGKWSTIGDKKFSLIQILVEIGCYS